MYKLNPDNLGPFDCDFEEGLCGWTNTEKNDVFDWSLNSGSTQAEHTGPENDHTNGSEMNLNKN